ncbi:Ppx/GppA phosphatase family protein [Glacieibacterium frigidum]|uniref:Ppx/GppA family phosphatase n=1 Tax=Glacieibacterium frigidum TaxID=2593303 RepID=A0A552UAN1_9SPHN|nr:Ppx/GppA phosphatase family protein [Glacieibacterium frigidum]TRW15273.1 Ppx/GppA family phosphatase [Glacieibacterium frigidum]
MLAGQTAPAESYRPRTRTFGALDLGTNNCRLLIARPGAGGFTIVDAFSRIVRLGEGLVQSGRLSDRAQDRAIEALRICSEKLQRRQVFVTRNVATEACRRASNGAAFVDRVYAETGIALDVITPAEEARLAVLGCQSLIDPDGPPALVFDIGGGSTELSLVRADARGEPEMLAWVSVPWGVVSLAETEAIVLPPEERGPAFERMRALAAGHLTRFAADVARLAPGPIQLLGTSGTITTLASVHLGLPAYDRRQVDGCMVTAVAMREISAMLSSRSPAERAEVTCIGHERADLVVAGCAILLAILDCWPAEEIRVADRGIREGILRTLMARP